MISKINLKNIILSSVLIVIAGCSSAPEDEDVDLVLRNRSAQSLYDDLAVGPL